MAIADDIEIIGLNIRYTGTNANHTILAFHRWLGDLSDDAFPALPASDQLAIPNETPSEKSTANIIALQNGYNIDDTLAIHLYDGSVSQDDGDTLYAGLVVLGKVEAGTNVMIVQNNVLLSDTWSAFPNADATQKIVLRMMVKVRENGVDIDERRILTFAREFGDSYAEFDPQLNPGNNVSALSTNPDGNNTTVQATVAAWTVPNTEGYQLLDMTAVGSAEPFYSKWDLSTGPRSQNDAYEFAKNIQRRTSGETIHGMNGQLFRGITDEWDYDAESGVSPATNDQYVWGLRIVYDNLTNSFAVGDAVSIGGDSFGRILSLDTLEMIVAIEVDNTPIDGDPIVQLSSPATATADVDTTIVGQATGGGMATLLAVLDAGTTGTVWTQVAKGTAPANNAICYEVGTHANLLVVNLAPTARPVSTPFLGVSTGSAINPGAFGIGFDPNDVGANDKFVDLTGADAQPPNNVTFVVGGIESGDQVLVGPESGGALQKDQFGIKSASALTVDNITSVLIDATIPSDTPATGFIRVVDDNGIDRQLAYSGYATDTFTITTTNGQEDFAGVNASVANNVYISYIDETSAGVTVDFTTVFDSPRPLFIRVREGTSGTPIKTFETTGTLGAAGGSATANRISDL